MKYFCQIDSTGDIGATNLQLYSLMKSASEWNEYVDLSKTERLNYPDERKAFIINCFGLSLSQLLGQNNPSPDKEQTPNPRELLSALLNQSIIDRLTRKRLNSTFEDFLIYYSAVRHFGKIKDDKYYKSIDELSDLMLDHFREMTIEIWDILIAIYRQNKENNIDEFKSIGDIICFEPLIVTQAS